MAMKRFFLYLLLTLVPLLSVAQGVVEGVVTDAKSGSPLEFVNVGIGRQARRPIPRGFISWNSRATTA